MSRWLLLLTLVVAASLAGCFRPLASDREPDRESVNIPRGEFFGEVLSANSTMRLSVVPGEVVAPVSEEPVNCFVLEDAADERQSYLGGVSIDLEWTATSPMTEALNVSVQSNRGPIFAEEGTSPFHFLVVANGDDVHVRTPLTVRVTPAGLGVPVPDQPIAWTAKVGILESAIAAIHWRHCEVTDLPVEVPPRAAVTVPPASSVLAG